MSEDTYKSIIAWAIPTLGLLAALLVFLSKPEVWNSFLKIWNKIIKPSVKVVVAPATLVIPNGFIIGFLMYRIAIYYFEAGSLEFVITNSRVFVQLVGAQACLVSLYSFIWAIFIYPRIRTWFISDKPSSGTQAKNNEPLKSKQNGETVAK